MTRRARAIRVAGFVLAAGFVLLWSWISADLKLVLRIISSNQHPLPSLAIAAIHAAEDPPFLGPPRFRTITSYWRLFFSLATGHPPSPAFTAASLTQQLLRQHLSGLNSRKTREFLISAILDLRARNEEITLAYANLVYLGTVCGEPIYGVRAASSAYFNSPPEQLSLAQLLALASSIRRPSYFSPLSANPRVVERRRHVLAEMKARGFITSAEVSAPELTPTPPTASSAKKRRD